MEAVHREAMHLWMASTGRGPRVHGNLMHEARRDMFWSWKRFVRVLEENHGLGMDALVSVCSWNTNGYIGLAMDALVTVCSWNTNGIMVLRMDALVNVCSWNTNRIMVCAWMLWSPYALGKQTELWCWHGCSGQRMLLEHEPNHGLRMDALVSVCSWNTNRIMVCAWMLWSVYALGTRTESWFALVTVCPGTRTELWFWHGCSDDRMLLEHERNYGFGMVALVSVCSLEHERNYELGMDALVSVMLLENEYTYWPAQYFVKVVSCRSVPYTVKVSESRLPDESKFLHFAETQKCSQHQHFSHFQALESSQNTAKASKFRFGRGR